MYSNYVEDMQTSWLICLILIFKVKGLFKMTSCKKSLPLIGCYDGIRRSILPEVFLDKGAVKLCSKFTGKHPC